MVARAWPLLLLSTPTNMSVTSAVAKPARPHKYTADKPRVQSNVARARRQAAKSTIVVKSPNTWWAERAVVQRARRQSRAFRKLKVQADRDSKCFERQED
uniref:Putative secreted protein n=1 Tax=Ixodes scapularis TaxID=6945 RepID=A0A4D5RG10_IXOSC